jgi:hypothetical protein
VSAFWSLAVLVPYAGLAGKTSQSIETLPDLNASGCLVIFKGGQTGARCHQVNKARTWPDVKTQARLVLQLLAIVGHAPLFVPPVIFTRHDFLLQKKGPLLRPLGYRFFYRLSENPRFSFFAPPLLAFALLWCF